MVTNAIVCSQNVSGNRVKFICEVDDEVFDGVFRMVFLFTSWVHFERQAKIRRKPRE